MAKKAKRGRQAGVNKSQAIRDYLAKHPKAMPKEIIAALQKIQVSPALVNAVKYGAKPKARKKKAVSKKPAPGTSITVTDLMQAKALADQMGGMVKAKVALDTLEKLR